MKNIRIIGLGICIFLFFSSLQVFGLDSFYLQNGDAYLLIGNGPSNGVYKLNNLTGAAPQTLYVPGEAFNLSASMHLVSGSSPQKDLWTFVSAGTTGMQVTTRQLVRQVMTSVYIDPNVGGTVSFTGARNQIVHVHHNYPGNTKSGIGIHDPKSYPVPYCGSYGFWGDDYPCSWAPTPVTGQPGYFYIDNGKWYHSADPADVIYSSFPYLHPDWFGTSHPNTLYPPYNMYGFVTCMDGAGWPFQGGTCHKLVRETVQTNERILNLLDYNVTSNTGPTNIGECGRVVISSTNTKDTLDECGDPCAPGTGPGTPLPYGTQPVMDCKVSGAGRSYLYTRDPSSVVYTLKMNNSTFSGSTVGDPTDLSAMKLGLSSKDGSSDWVYVLGITEINKWLKAAGVPATAFLNQLTDVAVSDQWWQTGGIVYAYDKSKGFVYKFVRNEITKVPPVPEIINVYDGTTYPDSIDADGFGHLYLVKTVKMPANAPGSDMPSFAAADAYSYYVKNTIPTTLYSARFKQLVTKSVIKRDYYTGAFSQLSGSIVLGTNLFEMDFTCPASPATAINNPANWTMYPPARRTSPDVSSNYTTEVAVINVCTPPPVSSTFARIDINGPFVSNSGTLGDAPTPYNDSTQYFFSVENAPTWDLNDVNTNVSSTIDPNKNTFIGMFPSTTKRSSLQFYWRIIQTKNRYGEAINNTIMDGTTPTNRVIQPVSFGPGEYEIAVKANFQYYQYDLIPTGVLADKKENYVSAVQNAISQDGSGWAKATIKIQSYSLPTYPGGNCVIMSGKPNIGSGFTYHPVLSGVAPSLKSESTLETATPNNPPPHCYIIPQMIGSQKWSFKLREHLDNQNKGIDRINTMISASPPIPSEPYSNLQWSTPSPIFTWKISLPDVSLTQTLVDITKTTYVPQLDITPGDLVMQIPCEPASYSLRVDASRVYSYDYYENTPKILADGTVIQVPELKTKFITISVGGTCPVIVLDNTSPSLTLPDVAGNQTLAWNQTPQVLWGTTGEVLANAEGKANPDRIFFWVADDNPFGNIVAHPNITTPPLADPFFPEYKVKHVATNRVASFTYSNAMGQRVPQDLPTAATPNGSRYRTNPDGTNAASPGTYAVYQYDYTPDNLPTTSGLSKIRSWSYRCYQIDISSLAHFSASGNNFAAEMAPNYANQILGYHNLNFGFGASDASGNASGPVTCGQIVIRDNDRPNVFLRAVDEKSTTTFLDAPSNIQPSYMTAWTNLAIGTGCEENHSGVETWDAGSNLNAPLTLFGFANNFRLGSLLSVYPVLAQEIVNGTSTLQIDVPVVFSTLMSDNVNTPVRISWRLYDQSNTLLADMGTQPNYRYIFRVAGNYLAEIQIRDNALDWPSDFNSPQNASFKYNLRTLRAVIPIADSRLNVRILEKNVK
ncbi:MAG: hypothetical protein HQM08_00960 [Candidatus Riflebacteria bacterium]|nr:hypothetical protein [Candidatus Riflebacteria bacterium]